MTVYHSLHEANAARQIEWDADNQITLAYRGNELAGEVGEACNVIKKLERERLGIRGSRDTVEHLAEELADIEICNGLIAMQAGIDLDAAVVEKFNATSEKMGLETRLALRVPAPTASTCPSWVQAANAALQAYEADLGEPLDDQHELGRIDDSRGSSSFRIRVGHIRGLLAAAPPPQSTAMTDEPFGWIVGSIERKVANMVFFNEDSAIEHYERTKGILHEWVKVEPIYAAPPSPDTVRKSSSSELWAAHQALSSLGEWQGNNADLLWDEITRLNAALSSAPVAPAAPVAETKDQWQDISTAPKDGSRCDVWAVYTDAYEAKGQRYVDAQYREHEKSWLDRYGNKLDWSELDESDDMKPRGRRTTHWMPTPTGPLARNDEKSPS